LNFEFNTYKDPKTHNPKPSDFEEEFKKWDEGIFRVTEREQQSEESKRS
jgi:hypothetical protein